MCPWRTGDRLEVQYPHVPLKVGSWKYLVNSGSDKLKRPWNLHQESQLLVKSISGSFSQHQGTAVSCGGIKTGTTWFQPQTSSLTKDTSLYQFPYQNQFSQTLLGITGYWCFVGNKGGGNVWGALRVFLSSPSLLLCLLPYPFGGGLCLLQSYLNEHSKSTCVIKWAGLSLQRKKVWSWGKGQLSSRGASCLLPDVFEYTRGTFWMFTVTGCTGGIWQVFTGDANGFAMPRTVLTSRGRCCSGYQYLRKRGEAAVSSECGISVICASSELQRGLQSGCQIENGF